MPYVHRVNEEAWAHTLTPTNCHPDISPISLVITPSSHIINHPTQDVNLTSTVILPLINPHPHRSHISPSFQTVILFLTSTPLSLVNPIISHHSATTRLPYTSSQYSLTPTLAVTSPIINPAPVSYPPYHIII